jgi:hypothetical protein
VLALEQVGDSDGELDDLDATLDVTARVGDCLAVFQREQFGGFVGVFINQVDESHHHPRPTLRIKATHSFCAETAIATAALTSAADAMGTCA